ncbi:MAG: ABC transporter ATP-binding protein [Alphaproteobacteria bacterium]|nr:ABC transporter ATP-binding protein [Alphaproteobacteria bacterium]
MTLIVPKISVRDVHKAFGSNVVLDGSTLDVAKGESLVIIGGSGTGKSVLLKCVLGLLRPDSGKIEVDGQNVIGLNGADKMAYMGRIGMLFQGAALFDSLKVWENVAFGLMQGKGTPKKLAREIALEKLNDVGLAPRVADLMPAELSGGMQKRVGLARAVAGDPEIIFFDEPTTGLDPIMADVINDLIVECTREKGITTMTITHDMASAKKIATSVAMIYEGKIIWRGDAGEIYDSGNAYVDQFVHGRAQGPISFGQGQAQHEVQKA